MLPRLRNRFVRTLASSKGMTLIELMIVGILAGIVGLAAVAMYIASLDTWDQSGARLAVQRDAYLATERVLFDVRRGSRVEVSGDSTAVTIIWDAVGGDSTIAVYSLDGDELKDSQNLPFLDKIERLTFSETGSVRLRMQFRVQDDMGTPGIPEDDEGVSIDATAVCRNRAP